MSHLAARIDDKGNLRMEGQDIGRLVEKTWGQDEYEYAVTVDRLLKDTVLLNLLKERFKTTSEFMEWLKGKKLEYEFWSWP